MKKIISALFITTMLTNLTACGTILYPERKGQKEGQIDVGIALMDGVGLLFFFIPGVIAYAVDFSNGTIYLPGGKKHSNSELDTDDMISVNVGKENLTKANIEKVIQEKTGEKIDTSDAKIEAFKINEDGEKILVSNNLFM